MTRDEHFAEKAIELAKLAARAIDEARSYADDIDSQYLREKTEREINKIIDEL